MWIETTELRFVGSSGSAAEIGERRHITDSELTARMGASVRGKRLSNCLLNIIAIPYTNPLVVQFKDVHAELARLEALSGLAEVIDDLLPDGNDSVRDLRALAVETLGVAGEDRDGFLTELSMPIAKPEVPSEVSDVRIMSLHKSKGLSSPITIIAGCVQGLLPRLPDADLSDTEQRSQMEEQRRLFYVGITRVKAVPEEGKPGTLILTYSRQMLVADAMTAGIQPAGVQYGNAHLIASQFISELGPTAPTPRRG